MRGGWVERGTVLIRLTRPHFAFFRGYLDSLDIGMLAEHYLETTAYTGERSIDLRVAKSSIDWIRGQLAHAARRCGNPTSARLLQLPPEALQVQYDSKVPSLDEYREIRDPYEVYSEEDLIELFKEEYGGAGSKRDQRRAARNDRLRTKQRIALHQLEELVAADPKLSDRVDGWIDPVVAKCLKAAGIGTVADLINSINGWGFRWYSRVPGVGEKAARQIARWLTTPAVADALPVKLHVRALTKKRDLPAQVPPVRPPRTDIVPLEQFAMPSELDGSHGTNRGERTLLSARNDLQAVYSWLGLCKPDSHTFRSYRKEAERFVLWAIMEKGKPLSSLTVDDCRDYRDFLWYLGTTVELPVPSPSDADANAVIDPAAPDPRASATYRKPSTVTVLETTYWHTRFRLPQERWIAPRGTDRWSEFWRPFEGKLSAASQTTALVIIQSMLQWLTDQHYLHGNPMKGVKRLTKRAERIDTTRSLSRAEWDAVKDFLATMKHDDDSTPATRAQNDKYYRLRLIIALAYATGMRLSELAALRREHFNTFVRLEDGVTCWEAKIVGKGDVARSIQINRALISELNTYFVRRGHKSFTGAQGDTPVIASLPHYDKQKCPVHGSLDDPISEMRLYELLKSFFGKVAKAVDQENPEMASALVRASTHWLRHTYATHALEAGMSLEVVRDMLGHASLDTTSVYVNTERDRNSKEAEELGPAL